MPRGWRNIGLVICWIKRGKSKRYIAERTGLTVNQVYHYWYRHLEKNGGQKGRAGNTRLDPAIATARSQT